MDAANYISYRLLEEVCAIPVTRDPRFEAGFHKLMDYLDEYTEFIGTRLSNALLIRKTNRFAAITTANKMYGDILGYMKEYHSPLTLRVLFVATFYMMCVYKEELVIARHIARRFEVVSSRSRAWGDLIEVRDQRECILL